MFTNRKLFSFCFSIFSLFFPIKIIFTFNVKFKIEIAESTRMCLPTTYQMYHVCCWNASANRRPGPTRV